MTDIDKPRKLARLSFRLLPEHRERLNAIARERGITISQLMRPIAEVVIVTASKPEKPVA